MRSCIYSCHSLAVSHFQWLYPCMEGLNSPQVPLFTELPLSWGTDACVSAGCEDLGVTVTVASFGATALSLVVLLCLPHLLVNSSSSKSSGYPKLSALFPSGVLMDAWCNDPTRHVPLLFLWGRQGK